jgi:hypothetical protein
LQNVDRTANDGQAVKLRLERRKFSPKLVYCYAHVCHVRFPLSAIAQDGGGRA